MKLHASHCYTSLSIVNEPLMIIVTACQVLIALHISFSNIDCLKIYCFIEVCQFLE